MLTLGDIDGDDTLDVVVAVATAEGSGEVWALSAQDGLSLSHFPVELHNRWVGPSGVCLDVRTGLVLFVVFTCFFLRFD